MKSERVKAILLAVSIYGGITWWLFGFPGLDLLTNSIKSSTANKSSIENAKGSSKGSSNENSNEKNTTKTGSVIDSYKGVQVYYNGSVGHVNGRNTTPDGYNIGLKYQCVEFAKRFYYEAYDHKMPNSYGHAKDFFNSNYKHGTLNSERNMYQYENYGSEKPKPNDMIIIGPSQFNKFGHLVIITKVYKNEVSFIQQNPGPKNPSRGKFRLEYNDGQWSINSNNILGWLRIK